MRRVLIAGISGAGKTTMARELSARLGIPRHELDALHHGPNWTKRPSFEADVAAFVDEPSWVTEDQYQRLIGDQLWQRADTVVWLDLPRRVVMWRVLKRSLGRALRRTELWNGNREHWTHLVHADHPIRWAWRMHGARRERIAEQASAHSGVRVVRLRTPRSVRDWLDGVG